MSGPGRLEQIEHAIEHLNIPILGISECRWNGQGEHNMSNGGKLVYSGRPENEARMDGVAFLLNKEASNSLMQWTPVNERIITARFHSRLRNISIVQVYASTEAAENEIKSAFYSSLSGVLSKIPKGDICICMGDFNSKVGADNDGFQHVMGKHGVGTRNNNGSLLLDFCSQFGLMVGGTLFLHKTSHKTTWISPGGRTENQIDHFCISKTWRHCLCDVRVKRSADGGSDHQLLVATLKLKVAAIKITAEPVVSRKFNLEKLKAKTTCKDFEERLISHLPNQPPPNSDVETMWTFAKTALLNTSAEILGPTERGKKPWMCENTWKLIEDRCAAKRKRDDISTDRPLLKHQAMLTYNAIHKKVKKRVGRTRECGQMTWRPGLRRQPDVPTQNPSL